MIEQALEILVDTLKDRECAFIDIPGDQDSIHNGLKYDRADTAWYIVMEPNDLTYVRDYFLIPGMWSLAHMLKEEFPGKLYFRPLITGQNLVKKNICLNLKTEISVRVFSILVANELPSV